MDVVMDILQFVTAAKPQSEFATSLYNQYCNRGGLSKKQLEGLHKIANSIEGYHPGKLATLEAIIKKKPTRYKSELPTQINPIIEEDPSVEKIKIMLEKYPQHKRLLFLQSKQNNKEVLSPTEKGEVEKFEKLLLSKK